MSNAKIIWDQRGIPTSPDFDDVYFSPINGLNETRYVFLDGNNLEERFKTAKGVFTIIETGFGTGLNFLTTCELWQKAAPKEATLHFISIEKHPVLLNDLIKAHEMFPETKEQSQNLCSAYENFLEYKVHTENTASNIKLTLLIGDVCEILPKTPSKANAWFLDGFSPAKNPEMWNERLYNLMFEHSNDGATLATFTAASHVRNGLIDAGFCIERRKGFAYKKHMTTGHK